MNTYSPNEMTEAPNTEEYKKELHGLFYEIQHLKSSENYHRYLQFLCRFKSYSPFNVSLVYAQKPTTGYFATRSHWKWEFKREVKKDARPLVMLRPGGPVMFVYDITETVGDEKLVPEEITEPYKVSGTIDYNPLDNLAESVVNLRIIVRQSVDIIQSGGKVIRLSDKAYKEGPRFLITLNKRQSDEVNLLTLIHELAHIFCGHLDSLDDEKWPNRAGLNSESMEFEAESVGYLVCKRLGLNTNSDHYLAGYVKREEFIPEISVQSVIRAVEWIEKLIQGRAVRLFKEN